MTRACDGCTLCCKLLEIVELKKPMGAWCPHAAKGQGCKIYDERPPTCRQFNCFWLSNADVPDYWKPDRSRMVLAVDETGTVISVVVDAGYPDAWRKAPYYDDLKAWARQRTTRIQVLPPKQGWIIFPEEDLFLGQRRPDDQIVALGYKRVGGSRQPAVSVRHADGSVTEVLGRLHPLAE